MKTTYEIYLDCVDVQNKKDFHGVLTTKGFQHFTTSTAVEFDSPIRAIREAQKHIEIIQDSNSYFGKRKISVQKLMKTIDGEVYAEEVYMQIIE